MGLFLNPPASHDESTSHKSLEYKSALPWKIASRLMMHRGFIDINKNGNGAVVNVINGKLPHVDNFLGKASTLSIAIILNSFNQQCICCGFFVVCVP